MILVIIIIHERVQGHGVFARASRGECMALSGVSASRVETAVLKGSPVF